MIHPDKTDMDVLLNQSLKHYVIVHVELQRANGTKLSPVASFELSGVLEARERDGQLGYGLMHHDTWFSSKDVTSYTSYTPRDSS